MSEVVSKSVGPQRFRGQLFGVFAAAALGLTLVGLAAVMSCSVATRTHEMGVRMALGAVPGDVVKMVLREGIRLALLGIPLGLLAAWWLSRYVGSLLYGVSATDPWTYAGAAVVLVVGGLLAALLPALRASRVDPAVALRYE
jgi:ABC-type antimicrobial peptide transport system permease subunit